MGTDQSSTKEQQAKREAAKRPGQHDVHEQREHDQEQEGAVAPQLPHFSSDEDPPPRRSGAV
ncbi:MAG TPA: hypothetical protein VM925_15895 [Labilithrix sp.]|jgi:hypothetical protein|nr:hypothetical protein [Labilithrix sp.]